MTTYAVFVRAVNVGGHNRLPMPAFREILGALGYAGVTTYLQSGNALFTGPRHNTTEVEEDIEGALAARLDLAVTVMVRTAGELAALVAANPLPAGASEPARLHVAFLSGPADPARLSTMDLSRFAPDEAHAGERALYLWYPNGMGRSKLTTAVLEKGVGGPVTARNWNTLTTLLEQATTKG